MSTHTPQTARIQSRLERWELDHLRALAAVQAEEIERLRAQLAYAEDVEIWLERDRDALCDALHADPAAHGRIGLTMAGDLVSLGG